MNMMERRRHDGEVGVQQMKEGGEVGPRFVKAPGTTLPGVEGHRGFRGCGVTRTRCSQAHCG